MSGSGQVAAVAAAARAERRGRDDLLAEQPPHHVDLVDCGIGDQRVAVVVGRHARIAMRAVHHQRQADRPRVDRRLQRPIGRVVAGACSPPERGGVRRQPPPQECVSRRPRRWRAASRRTPAFRRRSTRERNPRAWGPTSRRLSHRPSLSLIRALPVRVDQSAARNAAAAALAISASTSVTATTLVPDSARSVDGYGPSRSSQYR